MFLVHGHVIGKERPFGEEESWHRLAGGVHETGCSKPDRRLKSIECRHEVVLENDVRRIAGGLGDRRRVHDGLGATHDGEGVARVRQVGLDVVRLAFLRPLEDRRRQVGRPHVVARLL
jgi:hypothetical protein